MNRLAISPFVPANEHAALIRDRNISSQELVDLYLSRIHRYNPHLRAIVVSNEADARQGARERDNDLARSLVRGPLHGVPITVKESFNLAGHKTTINFPRFRDNVAHSDALIVKRLKDAGAIVLGKTNVPTMLADYQTFGPLYPAANNPHDLTRTPGGSTGGGAAAVAAGLTPLEIGSNLGGSIRVPAHFCGIFALKPTENAMHGDGHVPPTPGGGGFAAMTSFGPLARAMSDIELAWRIINAPSWEYGLHLPQRSRVKTAFSEYNVAWFDDAGPVHCSRETKEVLNGFLQSLQAAGVKLEKRPFDDQWLNEACAVWAFLLASIVGQDASWIERQVMKLQFAETAAGSAFPVAAQWRTGLNLQLTKLSHALRRRAELIQGLQRRFTEYDFIVSPVAAGPAFPHNPRRLPIEVDGRRLAYIDYAMPFTIPYNACGNPVLIVPAGRSAAGLPIGLQIAAAHYRESELIHFGRLLEGIGLHCIMPLGFDQPGLAISKSGETPDTSRSRSMYMPSVSGPFTSRRSYQ